MSSATIVKLGNNENISMESLEKLCEVLECSVEEIVRNKISLKREGGYWDFKEKWRITKGNFYWI